MSRTFRSDRTAALTQSYIRRMTRECDRVGGINLGQGVCDLPTPRSILEGASEVILADKMSTYGKFEGIDALRHEIARKATEFNKIPGVNEDTDIVVTIGATGALNCIIQALFNPGDEFIIFEPYYGYHLNTMRVGGVVPKFVTLEPPHWQFTREMLEEKVTPNTRAIIFSTPTNPSGKVYTRDELQVIADFCRDHDILAITDEIYEYIVSDGAEHISLASLPGMYERTLTIGGFSKTFSITGWRLGFVVAPEALAGPIGLVNDLLYVCAPTPLQYGVAVGMAQIPASYYTEMSADYQKKRDMFCAALVEAGLTPHVPDGAYYVLSDVTRLGFDDDKAAAMHILETVGIASVPGSSFFQSPIGKTLTRFCYAKDWDVLKRACEQIVKLA
ncbi:MAG: aminotransferase class I/II-fold pyridoxal phosphate-dependent enzyme [bacterium]